MNRFLSALEKVGHVSKVVGKDTAKGAEIIAPIALPFVPVIGPEAATVAKSLLEIHGVNLVRGENMGTAAAPLNPLETFAITMILGIIQTTVKNPAHKAALQNQLVGIATDIFEEYGMTVPVAPAVSIAAPGPVVTT